ncbi:FtsK/SpoIIIE domain-containing protein [Jeotgalicoccus marinus]|uniref:FtsK/SpoIIIE domain-containing protein n=1 Tax=Jeotgalicoccus marinus TaxID=516700 RepID=UPI001B7FC5BA|nr:FtsK/SpoIIIE domain-containing protein [Jeotgalicoccus marinus]
MTRRLRKHIKDARFEDEHEFDNHLVKLPKIKILFDSNHSRATGRILIKNSIKFDKKLENIRIDSALNGYVCERSYLTHDRDWYVFEFYSIDSHKQIEFKTKEDYLNWTNITTDDYTLRLDERTTVPFHHLGLAGQTGSGKSFFIQMLVDQIISKETNHELFIIDPKRSDVYQMSKRINGNEKTADKREAINLIKTFHKRLEERQTELEPFFQNNHNKTYKDAGLPALILLIDEFGALKESWKSLPKKERDTVENALTDIAFMGRQIGCILWVSTQQMNAQTISTDIRDQLVLKVVLGPSDEQTYRTLFASSVEVPPVQFSAGLGIFSYPEFASVDKPRILTVPYCSYLE